MKIGLNRALQCSCAALIAASLSALAPAQVDRPLVDAAPVAASPAPATAPPAAPQDRDAAAEQVLKEKGLTRVGATYLLDDDVHLREGLKDVRQSKAQIDRSKARRAVIEAQLRDADNKMDQLGRELRDVNAQLAQNPPPIRHNQLAAQNNMLVSALDEGRRFKAQKQKELNQISDPIDDYVTAVQSLASKMEAASQQYARLADDAQVKAALASINAHAPPRVKLGPSDAFAEVLPSILHQRDSINSSVITLEIEGGVPHVRVTINGTVTEEMVVDSGAAIMTIPFAVAKELGLKPSRNDAAIELVTANGQHVRSRVVHLDSVRLGQFTVKDVEAAILPAGAGSDGLLGGSFLQHFVYRMDLGARELHLSQIGGKSQPEKAGDDHSEPGPVASSPDATTRSASPPAAQNWISTMTGSLDHRDADGDVVLQGDDHLFTREAFAPPISFHVVAMTDSSNLRLGYGVKQIVFNWEVHRRDLRVDGFPNGRANRHKSGAGGIPTGKWVNIDLTVLPDSLTLSVDGQQRYHAEADFSQVRQPLSIFTAQSATVTVKSVEAKTP